MIPIGEKDYLAYKRQASETPTGLLSNGFNNRDHKNFLGSNKPRPPKAPTRLPQTLTPTPKNLGTNCYRKYDLNKIIQTLLIARNGLLSGDKLKARSVDVYYNMSQMECYSFCQ